MCKEKSADFSADFFTLINFYSSGAAQKKFMA